MPAPTIEDILKFKVSTDIKSAQKSLSELDREWKKTFQRITSLSEKSAKKQISYAEDIAEANSGLLESVEDLEDAQEALGKVERKLADLRNDSIGKTEDQQAAIDEQVNSLESLRKELTNVSKSMGKGRKQLAWEKTIGDPKQVRKLGKALNKEIWESMKGGFRSFLGKDAKGLAASFGEILQKTVTRVTLPAAMKGKAMAAHGAAMKAGGDARGGMAGAAMKAGGAALGGIGKALEAVSKIAPIMNAAVGVIMKLVELFIDAEAQVKQFNKDILSTASTTEFMGKSFGNAQMASMQLESTLREVRDAAYDARTNMDWGITADTHKAVLNVLNQEGISLSSVQEAARGAGKSVGDFSKELVTSSVAYSRLIGVPLQEINQLQAEMVTELGSGLQQTDMAFAQITKTANESGLSANKFFSIIRGVSQDLALWGNRMEDAVKLLGKLSKVMNPREAQKFMSTAMQGFKNMGRQERLRMTLLAGEGKMGKLIERDTKRKAAQLGEAVGMSADELIKTMRDPKGLATVSKQISDAVSSGKITKEQEGALRGAAIEMKEQMTAAGKGVFGKAIAARTMGVGGAMQAMEDAIKRFAPGKSLVEARGDIGVEMMAENMGISEEQLDSMTKNAQIMEATRTDLIDQLKNGTAEQKKQARIALKKAGIQGKSGEDSAADDADLIAQTQQAGYDQLIDAMDSSTKDEMEKQSKDMKDFAQEQSHLQTSMVDKLGMLTDFFMNQFYNIVVDIWDAIMSLVHPTQGDERRLQKQIFSSKDAELMKFWTGGMEDFKKNIVEQGGIYKGLDKAVGMMATGTDDEKMRAQKAIGDVGKMLDIAFNEKTGGPGGKGAAKAATKAGLSEDVADRIEKAMDEGKSFMDAMTEAQLSGTDKMKVMQNAMTEVSGESLVAIRKTLKMWDLVPGAKAPTYVAPTTAATGPTEPMPATTGGPAPVAVAPAAAAPATAAATPVVVPAAATGGGGAFPQPAVQPGVREFQDGMLDQLGYLGGQNDDIIRVLKRSVKLDRSFVTGELGTQIHDSVLKAVRKALVEYKLYKDVDMATFEKQLQAPGFDPESYGSDLMDAVQKGTADMTGAGATLQAAPGNATGGTIVGRNADGTAKVLRPPAGEMPAFVGPGEAIAPKGGGGRGGMSVSVAVNGIGGNDLAQMVKVAATNAIYEYKRRENLH